ncbi:MAG TPA: Xaa-Pro peptidase family protein [Thermoanaerobaculia bacterium]|nr:Xaa-Pro peptidase family protein [Thermoanaerobaculia bacterium]
MIADKITAIQRALKEAELDAWLFMCFQHNDPISLSLLGLAEKGLCTRRCYYLVPAEGEARRLVHRLEPGMLDHLPGSKSSYLTWQQHAQALRDLLSGCKAVAAQYSPEAQIPSISRLDAGTAELLRASGVELVSSSDLVQGFAAVWSGKQLDSHRRAADHLHRIVLHAFDRVAEGLRAGQALTEFGVQRWICEAFETSGLEGEGDPIVAVNEHSADPHYQPSAEGSSPIHEGDFLLIDLWAKERAAESVYADITWCGVCAPAPTDRQGEIFEIVRRARDAALALVQDRYPAHGMAPLMGFEVDDACRAVITEAGYGDDFFHRTGHSIDTSDHGQGANMDNLETHDTRVLVPMTGFSIEPGIYLTGDFGVRSEINVALTADKAEVTGGDSQRELLRLLS